MGEPGAASPHPGVRGSHLVLFRLPWPRCAGPGGCWCVSAGPSWKQLSDAVPGSPSLSPHGHRLLVPRPVTFQALQPDQSAASSLQTQVQRFQRLPRPRRLLPTRPCARDVGVPRFLPALTPRRWPVLFPTSSPHLCVDLSAPPPAHQASVSPPVRWGHEAVRTGDARGKSVRRARRTTSRPWGGGNTTVAVAALGGRPCECKSGSLSRG